MKIAITLLLSAILGFCFADIPRDPEPLVLTHSNPFQRRDVFLTVTPPKRNHQTGEFVHRGCVTANRLTAEGKVVALYQIKEVYSFEIYFSDDADILVLMGPWCSGQAPAAHDLAVAFYKGGKLLKRYSTLELVKRPAKVQISSSHYEWRAEGDFNAKGDINHLRPKLDSASFYLSTIDGLTYKFDATTGKIVYSNPFKTD